MFLTEEAAGPTVSSAPPQQLVTNTNINNNNNNNNNNSKRVEESKDSTVDASNLPKGINRLSREYNTARVFMPIELVLTAEW